jgi:asparagine synthase (glutamine-hydrolysing)
MCGICGIAVPKQLNRRVDEIALTRMRDAIAHRGPDDAGNFIGDQVGLGHRRLSIVDVSGGHQPMSNRNCPAGAGGAVHLAFNGEIYNHPQLRPMLESRGHRYNNNSDTETILHLYEDRGPATVEALSGMFAFALWDETNQRLLLARDRLGIKPLYYVHTEDGSLYFASEIKSLLASRALRAELNHRALPDYLANHAPSGEQTLFRNVKRLPPGHTLIWENGRIQLHQYWDASYRGEPAGAPQTDADYIAQWGEHFRNAVQSHLMADVPLGLFLSGGIDSSAIAAVMSKLVPDRFKTFSVAFADREANELEFARLVAGAFRTEHHEIIVTPEQYFSALPKMIWHEDEPLAHFASIPLYFVSKLAAGQVKVVLTGEGSDELLAGYGKYRYTVYNLAMGRAYQQVTPGPLQKLIRSGLNFASTANLNRRLRQTFFWREANLERLYFDNFGVFPNAVQDQLLTNAAKEQVGDLNPYANIRNLIEACDSSGLLNRLLYADMKTYLHELLMKQDQMSMAASLESRVPFLDWALVEFSTRMPERMKLRGWTTKYVLRQAMKDLLPQEILRRPKMGFPVPIASWFRGAFSGMLDEYVLSDRVAARGLFEPEVLRRTVAEHRGGVNHQYRLWSLVNFEIWMRQFMDGEMIAATEPAPIVKPATAR